MRRDVEDDRRRRKVMHAVTLDAPRPLGATRSSFAAVVEDHLDDVYGYLLYLTKNWAVAEDLTSETFEAALGKWRRFDPGRGTAAGVAARHRTLDRPRLVSRRFPTPQARGALVRRRAHAGRGALVRRAARRLPRTRGRAARALGRRAGGRRPAGRTRPRRRSDRWAPRHLDHGRLDAVEPCSDEARREDERP